MSSHRIRWLAKRKTKQRKRAAYLVRRAARDALLYIKFPYEAAR